MRKVSIIEGYPRTRLVHMSHSFNGINWDHKFWLNPRFQELSRSYLAFTLETRVVFILFLLTILFLFCSVCSKVLFFSFCFSTELWVGLRVVSGMKKSFCYFHEYCFDPRLDLESGQNIFNSNASIHWRVKPNKRTIISKFMVLLYLLHPVEW